MKQQLENYKTIYRNIKIPEEILDEKWRVVDPLLEPQRKFFPYSVSTLISGIILFLFLSIGVASALAGPGNLISDIASKASSVFFKKEQSTPTPTPKLLNASPTPTTSLTPNKKGDKKDEVNGEGKETETTEKKTERKEENVKEAIEKIRRNIENFFDKHFDNNSDSNNLNSSEQESKSKGE